MWAVAKMKEWGLENVRLEPWPADASGTNNGFPRGWTNEKFYLAAVSPQAFPIPGRRRPGRQAPTASFAATSCSSPKRRKRNSKAKYAGGKLKGKWVHHGRPPRMSQAYWNAAGAALSRREELDRMESPGLRRRRLVDDASRARPEAAGAAGGSGGRTRRWPARRRAGGTAVQPQRVLPDRRRPRHVLDRAARSRHLHDWRRFAHSRPGDAAAGDRRFRPNSTAASRG